MNEKPYITQIILQNILTTTIKNFIFWSGMAVELKQ